MKLAMPTVDPSDFSPATYLGPDALDGVVWHYTTSHVAKRIIADGCLRPQAQGYIGRDTPAGKRDILWFSKNHVWEPAACKAVPGFTFEWNGQRFPKAFDFRGMQKFGTKLVRFSIPDVLVPYSHHAAFRLAGFSLKDSRWLEHVGEQLGGKCADWRGTLEPVPQAQWLSIEIWHNGHCCWEVAWHP